MRKQSKICDRRFDYVLMSDINNLYLGFELLGIYEEYCRQSEYSQDDFYQYYISCTRIRRYHFRNLGVQTVYRRLEEKYKDSNGLEYKISKHSMRHLGITYPCAPVIVYESAYEVANVLFSMINEIDILKNIYHGHILKHSLQGDLTFQNDCLSFNLPTVETRRQIRFAEVRENLERLIETLP